MWCPYKVTVMCKHLEKTIDNLIMKKYPKGLDEIKCKHVNESIRTEFFDYFRFGNKPIEGVKVPMDKFLPPLGRIVYHPLNNTHENEIKHQNLMFHCINQHCPIYTILSYSNNPNKILEMRPRNRSTLSSSMFFYCGRTTYNLGHECNFHIIISCCWFFAHYSNHLIQFL